MLNAISNPYFAQKDNIYYVDALQAAQCCLDEDLEIQNNDRNKENYLPQNSIKTDLSYLHMIQEKDEEFDDFDDT